MDRFVDIAATHRLYEELFLRHQEALLAGDTARARQRFDTYRGLLAHHAALEEQHLLPLYERAGPIQGGAPVMYSGEHGKIDRFLERIGRALATLAGPRDRIALFDLEARLKGLLEHHFDREETLLFPTVGEVATDAERRAALGPFADEQARLRALLW